MENVLSPFEAEAYTDQLTAFDIKSIGNAKWLQQHEFIEKLNVQAHVNVTNEADDFVLEFLVSYEKIPVLIHELISIEVWREKVYPELVALNFAEKSSMLAYMTMYHEATVISLLEAVLYHKDAVQACEDNVIDLSEYCYRQILLLQTREPPKWKTPVDAKTQLALTGQEQLEDQIVGLPFDISVKALAVMRYLTDHVSALPLSCLTRMLNIHDLPSMISYLIANPPWTRTGKDDQLEKYYEGMWNAVDPKMRMQLTKSEAQVWLALYNLLQDPECARKYEYTTHNKNEILKVRGHFNEVLIDQIPMLRDLRRTLEELAVMEAPPPETTVVVEQLPEIKEHLLKVNANKWRSLAEYQNTKVYCPDENTMKLQAQRLAETYNLDVLESLIPEDPHCSKCGAVASLRCSRCKIEWYCRRQCQVEHWKEHKEMCKMITNAESAKAKEQT